MHRIAILDDYLDAARSCADWSVLAGRATTDVRPFRERRSGGLAVVCATAGARLACRVRSENALY
jgi:hypothetical protein